MIIQYFRGAQNNGQLVNSADCYSKYQQIKVFDINLPEIKWGSQEKRQKAYQEALKELEKNKKKYDIEKKKADEIWEEYLKADKESKKAPEDEDKKKEVDRLREESNKEQVILEPIKSKWEKSKIEVDRTKKELEKKDWIPVFNCNGIRVVQNYFIVIDGVFNNYDFDILLHNNVISITSNKVTLLPKDTRLLLTLIIGD